MSKAPPPFRSRSDAREAVDFAAVDNPLINQAFSLLSIVPKLRELPYHQAVDELRDQLAGEIRRFEDRPQVRGGGREQSSIASYFLCTLIDETVLNTPWGNQSSWGHQSLLIQFHGEAKGGERFFQLLDRLREHPDQSRHLIELAYLCLSLGFEGKYRHMASGMRDLDALRQELYLLIQRGKIDGEPPLSGHWQGLRDRHAPMERRVPIWVGTVVACALMMLIYMGFAYAVNRVSNQTYRQLADVALAQKPSAPTSPQPSPPPEVPPPSIPATSAPAPIPALKDRFERLLAPEVSRGMVEIVDGDIMRVSNAFPSGSDQIIRDYIPMLEKIAREMQDGSRLITVIGHTDDKPIFSVRFPSNWHLSQARAKNVATLLTAAAPLKGRVRFEGHAENEPIAPNDTAANRARNRRIDIHIR